MLKKKQIPIKNIFYMLCYAWDILDITKDINIKFDTCTDAENLLAMVFSYGLNKVIKYGLHGSYENREDELRTIKGKIDIQNTINRMSLIRKKIFCSYDEHTINNVLNRIIKYTIEELIRNTKIDKEIKGKLKKQSIYFGDIDKLPPTRQNISKIIINKNNSYYRLIINIAVMIYENVIPSEEVGRKTFKDFYRDDYMELVFEKFLLNFYKYHLKDKKYIVENPHIKWQHADNDDMWENIFTLDDHWPNRRTDILIENKELNMQIILDAKYYTNIFVKAYKSSEENRIRTSHLNQVRGYLIDSKFTGAKYGALIYPQVSIDVSQGQIVNIKDTPIVYKTINLYDNNWRNIEDDLLNFINKFELAHRKSIS